MSRDASPCFLTVRAAGRGPRARAPIAQVAGLVALAMACGAPPGPPADGRLPNVVIAVADDLGWNDVGYRGGTVATPVIDDLARRGLRLDGFRASPICTPSRARLMTGRYAIRFDLVGNVVPAAVGGLPPGERLLPEWFAAAGYRTASIGKWHLGAGAEFRPERRGFAHAYGNLGGWVDHFTHRRDAQLDWFRNGEPVSEPGYTADLVAREALRWLATIPDDEPVLLYLPFTEPHTPLQAPVERIEARAGVPDPRRRVFGAMVEALDASLGVVLDAVRRRPGGEETLVLFVSDNGGSLRYGADNGRWRAGKFSVYEGGLRVPAVLSWPGRLPEGAASSQSMTMLDVLPTLLSAIGRPAAAGARLDGRDLWPALVAGTSVEREPLYFASENDAAVRLAVLRGSEKLVCVVPAGRAPRRVELYDLARDEVERDELSGARPAAVAELFALAEAWWALHPRAAERPLGPPPGAP